MEVLPHEWHFLPKSPEKSIRFYKGILYQEKSARVEDIQDKTNPSRVLYHKFIIQNFVSCKDWGHPSTLKPLHYSRAQNPCIIIMTIWMHLKRCYSFKTRPMITHGSSSLTRISIAKYLHGSSSGGKCSVQFHRTSQNPYKTY